MKLKLFTLLGLLVSANNIMAQVFPVSDITINGPQDNRINIVVLPDGFQSAQLPGFKTKVGGISDYVFTITPFSNYAKFFNVYAVEVPSVDSGATHPGTATDVTEPASPVTSRNTFFDSRFDNGGVHRSVVAKNSNAVYSVLNNNFPAYDVPMVLVNSDVYGGTGGGYITFTINSSANETAVHELGHTFGKLWDEYWNNMPGEHPNMTQDNNAATIAWKNWLANPVPGLGIGIYPYGASSPQSTWYRPHQNCKMQFLGVPLCAVCKENIIDRIYDKVWPVNSLSPDTTNATVVTASAPMTFSYSPLKPNPNTLKYEWYLNGTSLSVTDTTVQINEAQLNMGSNTLTAVFTDTTLLSRSNLPGKGYMFSISWKLDRNWPAKVTSVNGARGTYQLYPIPAKNTLNLYYNNNGDAATVAYDISNIAGSTVKKGYVTLQSGAQTIPFDVSGLTPGVYNFSLHGEDIHVNTKMVIE